MKKNLRLSFLAKRQALLLTLLILAAPTFQAQQINLTTNPCVVEIHTPVNGDRVNKSVSVKGRANLPPEAYLWLLVQMDGFDADSWWPQPGPVRIDKDGTWKAVAFFGGEQDIGNNFVVAVVAVDDQRNGEMKRWLNTAQQRDYPPRNFPEHLSPCSSIPKVAVEKRGH